MKMTTWDAGESAYGYVDRGAAEWWSVPRAAALASAPWSSPRKGAGGRDARCVPPAWIAPPIR